MHLALEHRPALCQEHCQVGLDRAPFHKSLDKLHSWQLKVRISSRISCGDAYRIALPIASLRCH